MACGLALLPALYAGSFAFFIADELLEWGFWEALDDRTEYALQIFYWPLIQLYMLLAGP